MTVESNSFPFGSSSSSNRDRRSDRDGIADPLQSSLATVVDSVVGNQVPGRKEMVTERKLSFSFRSPAGNKVPSAAVAAAAVVVVVVVGDIIITTNNQPLRWK